jgi:NTP pyrophosphatase (non-canonical NTP hydrolase)
VTLPYTFVIVTENELLALMLADYHTHHKTLLTMIGTLDAQRNQVEQQLKAYKTDGDPLKLSVMMEQLLANLTNSATTTRLMRENSSTPPGFEELLKEMEMNRMTKSRKDNLRDKILEPLRSLTSAETGEFASAVMSGQKAVKTIEADAKKWLEGGAVDEAKKAQHVKNAERLLADSKMVLDRLSGLETVLRGLLQDDAILEILIWVEASQRLALDRLRTLEREYIDAVLRGAIGDDKEGPKK